MQDIFAELSKGNDNLFIEAMADEMKWIWMGSGLWSKTFNGKPEVLAKLWSAVRQTLIPPFKVLASNFIADGDFVTVEAIGQNCTPDGKTYNNKYCWICKITDGKIHELKEYMDTDLVTKTFTEKHTQIISRFYITQLIYLKDGQESVFNQFEDIAIPTIAKYNGRLLLRVRPSENSFVEISIERPFEIHLVEFDSETDFNNFMHDEERKRFLHLKEQSIKTVWLIKGTKIGSDN